MAAVDGSGGGWGRRNWDTEQRQYIWIHVGQAWARVVLITSLFVLLPYHNFA